MTMKFSEDELIEILSDVTTMLGTALAQYVELNESLLDQSAGAQTQQKIDTLKAKLDDEKSKLKKLRAAQQRRRELEKIRKDHKTKTPANESKSTSSGVVMLRDGKGQLVGSMRVAKDHTDYFTRTGKLIARYRDGKTYTAGGNYAGNLDQGMRLLGQSLASSR